MSQVTIYSTPTCPFCHQAKEYFKAKNIQFTDYNVFEDEKKAEEMIEKSGQMGVPVILINNEVVVGFDKEKINELLKL